MVRWHMGDVERRLTRLEAAYPAPSPAPDNESSWVDALTSTEHTQACAFLASIEPHLKIWPDGTPNLRGLTDDELAQLEQWVMLAESRRQEVRAPCEK